MANSMKDFFHESGFGGFMNDVLRASNDADVLYGLDNTPLGVQGDIVNNTKRLKTLKDNWMKDHQRIDDSVFQEMWEDADLRDSITNKYKNNIYNRATKNLNKKAGANVFQYVNDNGNRTINIDRKAYRGLEPSVSREVLKLYNATGLSGAKVGGNMFVEGMLDDYTSGAMSNADFVNFKTDNPRSEKVKKYIEAEKINNKANAAYYDDMNTMFSGYNEYNDIKQNEWAKNKSIDAILGEDFVNDMENNLDAMNDDSNWYARRTNKPLAQKVKAGNYTPTRGPKLKNSVIEEAVGTVDEAAGAERTISGSMNNIERLKKLKEEGYTPIKGKPIKSFKINEPVNSKKNLKVAKAVAKAGIGGLAIGAGIGLGMFIADTIYDESKE